MKHSFLDLKNKKAICLFVLPFVILLLVLLMIFSFSSKTADQSNVQSDAVTDIIIKIFVPDFDSFSDEQAKHIRSRTVHTVRKLAHFTEFALLGVSVMWVTFTVCYYIKPHFVINRRWLIQILPLLFGIVCAIIDECHQFFYDGRSPEITDVLIDSCGVLFGIIVVSLIVYIINRSKAKPNI